MQPARGPPGDVAKIAGRHTIAHKNKAPLLSRREKFLHRMPFRERGGVCETRIDHLSARLFLLAQLVPQALRAGLADKSRGRESRCPLCDSAIYIIGLSQAWIPHFF